MLFDVWEVRIVKNCDRGLENAARGRRFKSIVFQALKQKIPRRKKTHASVTVTVVRDRKIRTALRTSKIDDAMGASPFSLSKNYMPVKLHKNGILSFIDDLQISSGLTTGLNENIHHLGLEICFYKYIYLDSS